MPNKKNYELIPLFIAVVVVLGVAALVMSSVSSATGQYSNVPIYVSTPFPVDAWGKAGWDTCSSMSGGVAAADKFCKCKGATGVYNGGAGACYKEWKSSRNTWIPLANDYWGLGGCATKGNSTSIGLATTKIICYRLRNF